jgi:hypothetical protein
MGGGKIGVRREMDGMYLYSSYSYHSTSSGIDMQDIQIIYHI